MKYLAAALLLALGSPALAQSPPAAFVPFTMDETGYQQIMQALGRLPISDLNTVQQVANILVGMESKAATEVKKPAAPAKPK